MRCSGTLRAARGAAGQITSADYFDSPSVRRSRHRVDYVYDALGNRERMAEVDRAQRGPAKNPVTHYTANNLNQYTRIAVDGAANTPSYDANGNLTLAQGVDYHYNAHNQLIEVTPPTARMTQTHDPKGRVIERRYFAKGSQGQWIEDDTRSLRLIYDSAWNVIEDRGVCGEFRIGSTIRRHATVLPNTEQPDLQSMKFRRWLANGLMPQLAAAGRADYAPRPNRQLFLRSSGAHMTSSCMISVSRWLLAFALCAACNLQASVEWAQTHAKVRATAGQEAVEIEFGFKNTGASVVRIARVQPSCDCLAAHSLPEEIGPGESGKIAVRFTLGGRTGRQEKPVLVFFANQPERPVELRLAVDIPEPVAIAPRFVYWQIGEAAEEKAVDIVLADKSDRLGEVACADAGFIVRLAPTPDARRWRAMVAPVDTKNIRQAVVRLTATVAGQPRVFALYAAVR